MPLQYPSNSPYNPYQEPKTLKVRNWPKIILITLGTILLIGVIVYFYVNPPSLILI
ncbi:MAG: hypothetical protein WD876_04020 [Candidatus Pacearchaeota archaeon]